jgi:aminoglycoside 2''-phosphotransferase
LFPDLPVVGDVQLVGEGFSSCAVCVDERWIFRIGRNAETLIRHEREWAILPLLSARLPLPIPEPCWHAGPSEVFPFGVIGYPLLPGVPWTLDMGDQVEHERVARQLGEFLSALHAFPVDEALAAGVAAAEPPEALVNEVMPALPEHLDTQSYGRFSAWWAARQAHPERYEYTPRLLHGDLWCENILLAPDLSHIVGVVDFEQIRVGDPVSEFAALRYVGDGFIDRVRASYRLAGDLEPYFEERLRAAAILRELDGLRYALRYPESGELEDAVEKVGDVLAMEPPPGP